jgi:transcriptional regulator with XRE-family HTH domain
VQPFGEYLRDLRRQRRMDLNAVSKLSGLAVARLMALESGSGSPNRREVRQLARAFRMSGETMLLKAGQLRLILD